MDACGMPPNCNDTGLFEIESVTNNRNPQNLLRNIKVACTRYEAQWATGTSVCGQWESIKSHCEENLANFYFGPLVPLCARPVKEFSTYDGIDFAIAIGGGP